MTDSIDKLELRARSAEARARIAAAKASEADARAQLAISRARQENAKRLYESVKYSPQRPRRGSNASGDAVMQAAQGRLWEYARWLYENYDLAKGLVDDVVAKVIGNGVGVEPTVKDQRGNLLGDLNDQIKEKWRLFWESPEVTGELPGPDVERMVCLRLICDGEIFIQHVTKYTNIYKTKIPYALELLESDFVPYAYFDTKAGVVHGVQKDTWGRPLGYWTYLTHPGDTVALGALTGDIKYVPADSMSHLKLVKRLHQTRGASALHSVFSRLDDLKDLDDSTRTKARIDAAFCGVITRSADYIDTPIEPNSGAREFKMYPGMIFDNLAPGEDVKTIGSNSPNPALPAFREDNMRAIASGVGASHSAFSRNYDGTYSAQRQEMVETAVHYGVVFSYLMYKFYLPVWRRFVDAAIMAKEIVIPRGIQVREGSLYYPEFRPPKLPWIDPLKEATANKIAIDCGIKSRYQVIRDGNGDPAVVDAQIEADPFGDRFIAAKEIQPTSPAPIPAPVPEVEPVDPDVAPLLEDAA